MADKLAAVDLIPKRESVSLGEFIDSFVAKKAGIKESTRISFRGHRNRIIKHCGYRRREPGR